MEEACPRRGVYCPTYHDSPTWAWPRSVGSDAPLTPPHPRHQLTSHAACQCCSEHAYTGAQTEPRASGAASWDPRPAPPWLAVPGHLRPLLWGGPKRPGAGRPCNQGCHRERGGEGSPQPCWAGPGPSAAPPSTAHLPSTPPPPQTVAVNPRTPQALPLCAAALSRARLQDALGGFLLRDLLQAMAGGLVGPGRGPPGGGWAGDPLTADPSISGLNLCVQLCTCMAWK